MSGKKKVKIVYRDPQGWVSARVVCLAVVTRRGNNVGTTDAGRARFQTSSSADPTRYREKRLSVPVGRERG